MKVGVIYVAENQYTEEQILGNTEHTPQFSEFLTLLGDKVRLKGNIIAWIPDLKFFELKASIDNWISDYEMHFLNQDSIGIKVDLTLCMILPDYIQSLHVGEG